MNGPGDGCWPTIAGIGGRCAPQQLRQPIQPLGDASVGGRLAEAQAHPLRGSKLAGGEVLPARHPDIQGVGSLGELMAAPGLGQRQPGVHGSRLPAGARQQVTQQFAAPCQDLPLLFDQWHDLALAHQLAGQLDEQRAYHPARQAHRLGEGAAQGTWHQREADSQAATGDLGQAAEVDDPLRRQVDQRRHRCLGQQAVDVILDDQQIVAAGDGDDGLAPGLAHGGCGGVLQGWGEVEQLGTAGTAGRLQRGGD